MFVSFWFYACTQRLPLAFRAVISAENTKCRSDTLPPESKWLLAFRHLLIFKNEIMKILIIFILTLLLTRGVQMCFYIETVIKRFIKNRKKRKLN